MKDLGIKSDQKTVSYSYDNKNMKLNFTNAGEVVSVKAYNIAGVEKAGKNNEGNDNIIVDLSKLTEGVYIVVVTFSDDTKRTFKIFSLKEESFAYNLGTVNANFKWGYYDKYTENVVKKYQKLRGLNPSGVCDSKTIQKLLADAKKIDEVPNYGGLDLNDSAYSLARKNANAQIEKNQKEWEKKRISEVTTKEVQKELEKQKIKKTKEISDDMIDFEFDETMLNFVIKKSDSLIKN